MQKKRALVIFVIIFLVIAIICIFIYTGSDDVKYNNTKSKEELITVKYTSSQIEELKKWAHGGSMSFKQFKKQYKVECVRKSNFGYYAILLQDDGKQALVFITSYNDNPPIIRYIVVIDELKTKEEFERGIIEKVTTMSQVMKFDENYMPLAGSAIPMMVHYVQNGVFVVKYKRNIGEKTLKDYIVDCIEFVDNDAIISGEDDRYIYDVQTILNMDVADN